MGIVIFKLEVLIPESEQVSYFRIQLHGGQWSGIPAQLQMNLFEVIVVDMCIPKGMDELAWLEVRNLGNHHRQQCIGGYVEGDTQKDIRTALV